MADDFEKAREWGVRVAPTLIVMHDGAEIGRHVGAGSAADVERLLATAGSDITKARGRIGSSERRIRLGAGGLVAAIALASGTWWLLGLAALLTGAGLIDLLPKRPAMIGVET